MVINKRKYYLALAAKGYTAQELSNLCGVSQVTIARIVKGSQQARPATIGKIAKALDLQPADLLED